jgi:hypothetical protein
VLPWKQPSLFEWLVDHFTCVEMEEQELEWRNLRRCSSMCRLSAKPRVPVRSQQTLKQSPEALERIVISIHRRISNQRKRTKR